MRGPVLRNWVADFETTTDPLDCRVWAWGLCSIESPTLVEIGTDIESFLERVSKYDSVIYFHNLAFDGIFILDFIMKNGHTHTDNAPNPHEFSTLISNMGKFFSITVKWENGRRTEFRDSLKKLPMSVSSVAKAFKLEEGKGEIDYHTFRPVGHELTSEEREYLRKDVQIVAQALKIQLSQGMKKLTVGADSLAEFKRLMGAKRFERTFPILSESMDAEIRGAYRGGFTYADERFKGKVQGAGRVYDVNSLYPSVMYDRVLPYGIPRYTDGLPKVSERFPLFIVSITFTAKLKKNHIPCIQVKNHSHFIATEYQKAIKEPTTLMVTNVDLELWQEHYDLDILSYNGGWQFMGVKGIFEEYIDKWMEVKAHSDGGMRAIAKLHLNSLYGKFATNPNVTPKIPILDDDRVKLVTGEPETRNPVYTAMGVFITAYARDVTIRAAQENYDVFAYADTDSLHLLTETDPPGLDVHPSRLGAWKHEGNFTQALYVRAKAYTETMEDGSQSTHIAGLPDAIASRLRIADFTNGATFRGKLVPKRVPGGVVLSETGFTLSL